MHTKELKSKKFLVKGEGSRQSIIELVGRGGLLVRIRIFINNGWSGS